jgi:alpha-maltose-1-phosphate synthase
MGRCCRGGRRRRERHDSRAVSFELDSFELMADPWAEGRIGLPMKVVQATFGVFHQFELANQLLRRGHLRKIYSTWPWLRLKREGVPRECVGTFPWVQTPDYLLDRYRWYPAPVSLWMKRVNPIAFDHWTRMVVPECDAFIGIAGAGPMTGALVQRRGGKFVCDRGSTHKRFQEETIAAEFARWSVPFTPEEPYVVVREEEMYAAADRITVPSTVARRSFLAQGVAAEKVEVIPYGVRLERFQKTGEPPADSFEAIFAGQVSLRKGVPYLLEAFARVRHPQKRLTVVGAVQEHIRPLLERLPMENVTFVGAIPQAELIDRMSRSHVMVLPSIEEGLALVQAQSMACECPVIATFATGAEDLFTDGVEGFIVADRDVDALAERMQRVADDPGLRARMGAAARLRVKSLGGWDEYGRRWDEFLHGLTGIPRDAGEPA